jgi:hypothetical protein
MITIIPHTISQSLATAIFNDDYTGISASDNRAIEKFLKGYIRLSHYDHVNWTRCEITGAYADCIDVEQVIEVTP